MKSSCIDLIVILSPAAAGRRISAGIPRLARNDIERREMDLWFKVLFPEQIRY